MGIVPYLGRRQSISPESAKRILRDKTNAFHEESKRVLQYGQHWICLDSLGKENYEFVSRT